ncbi:hypothetical protein M413DRAFT_448794 [Hebeloma cylindrosporum]|uniref:Uncharacterized protein n=1 Tax=Hebeloma cylindrosporum TaxID=76867 RepID=A0A0C3BK89_HEBCY|nr:hypothetical protein M413DRAFT_448794 [Hebeloma cylindrosporum h7]
MYFREYSRSRCPWEFLQIASPAPNAGAETMPLSGPDLSPFYEPPEVIQGQRMAV